MGSEGDARTSGLCNPDSDVLPAGLVDPGEGQN